MERLPQKLVMQMLPEPLAQVSEESCSFLISRYRIIHMSPANIGGSMLENARHAAIMGWESAQKDALDV